MKFLHAFFCLFLTRIFRAKTVSNQVTVKRATPSLTLLIFAVLFWFGFNLPVTDADFTVFEKTYTRTAGPVLTVTNTFTVLNTNTRWTLHGASKDVADSSVTLNGVEVIGPDDLNPNINSIELEINLENENTISVRLAGQPGSQITITITGEDNTPPIADANGPYHSLLGEAVILDASGSIDPDQGQGDSIVSFKWDINDDGIFGEVNGVTPILTLEDLALFGIDTSGLFPIHLEVTDTFGDFDIATTQLVINENQSPIAVAAATPSRVAPEEVVTFDHSSSFHQDAAHRIIRYEWDFESDGVFDFATDDPFFTPQHAYPFLAGQLSRTEIALLRVTDDGEPAKTDTDTVEIVVTFPNTPPVAESGGPYQIHLDDDLTLDASGSFDPDEGAGDSIVSYEWDLDNDGDFGEILGQTITLSPEELVGFGIDAPGTFTIGLRVTDTFGEAQTDTTFLEVIDETSVTTVRAPVVEGIDVGEQFTVEIRVENVTDLAGWQLDLHFQPNVLEVLAVEEGNFFSDTGTDTFFDAGVADNVTGEITGVRETLLDATSAAGTGILVNITFMALEVGTSALDAQNVRLGNSLGQPIDHQVFVGQVTVGDKAPWDVNQDGIVDIFDLILVSQNFGLSPPEDERADVNRDGVVDILDLILVSQHFGQTTGFAAPALAAAMPGTQHQEMIQAWLTEARAKSDGSTAFEQGIAVLESLLNSIVPQHSRLLPNYPNPFNPETWIPFELAYASPVALSIYDSTGQLIRAIEVGYRSAGIYRSKNHAIYWDGRNDTGEDVASGVYFYTLTTEQFSATRRMVILK